MIKFAQHRLVQSCLGNKTSKYVPEMDSKAPFEHSRATWNRQSLPDSPAQYAPGASHLGCIVIVVLDKNDLKRDRQAIADRAEVAGPFTEVARAFRGKDVTESTKCLLCALGAESVSQICRGNYERDFCFPAEQLLRHTCIWIS
jgi:hypothetical protein